MLYQEISLLCRGSLADEARCTKTRHLQRKHPGPLLSPGYEKLLSMTIYLIKWENKDTKEKEVAAFSSQTAADKKLRELVKQSDIQVMLDEDQGPIRVHRPKTQADVINLINEL